MARSVQFNYTQEDLSLISEKKQSTLQVYSDRDMGDCGTPLIRKFQEVTGQLADLTALPLYQCGQGPYSLLNFCFAGDFLPS